MCSRSRGAALAAALLALALAACGSDEEGKLPAVASSVEPVCAANGAPAQIVVRGTMPVNPVVSMSADGKGALITTYRLWLGETELPEVRWVDASTLSATVPAGLPAGVYALAVESPFGERSTLDGAFRISQGPCDPTGAGLTIAAEARPALLAVGERVIVTAVITNSGDAPATGVTTSVSAPPGFAVFTSDTDVLDIPIGESRTYTWAYTANAGAGRGTFTVNASGQDVHGAHPIQAQAVTTNDVAVTYAVGGTVSNLPAGSTVVLQLNGGGDTAITQTGTGTTPRAFTFGAPVPSGTAYTVTILTQPTGQTCRINPGTESGTVTTQNVSSVQVNCDPNAMSLGTVVNGTGSIRCSTGGGAPTTCAQTYPYGTTVNLTAATTTAGWTFTGWSGACTGAGACSVTMLGDRSVTATFALNTYPLNVTIAGTGTIAAAPATPALSCTAASCTGTYQHGTQVTLTATPGTGYASVAWSGQCASTTPTTCTVDMVAARNVTATFALATYPLTVTVTGNGAITAQPVNNFTCPVGGAPCTGTYAHGTQVVLTAAPGTGSAAVTWGGECTSSTATTCTVDMLATRSVTAHFPLATFGLNVTMVGPGTIAANPADAFQCVGTTCTGTYPFQTQVTLTATPPAGGVIMGWTGCATSAGNTCTVTIGATPVNVGVTFGYPLSVVKTGDGTGTVTTAPAGLSCGATCTANFAHGTVVTVSQAAAATSDFMGWSGACTGAGACQVTVTSPQTVGAQFAVAYTVGGTVLGLVGNDTANVRLNGGPPLSTRDAFTFATRLHTGDPYQVTADAAGYSCTVPPQGTGVIAGSNVFITITCTGAPPL